MARAEATVEELVSMIERGRLRLPEMQRRYVWRSPRVRDLMDSLYRGYPSGAILLWETAEDVPLQDFAIAQQSNPYQTTQLLLDGQQRLTSLSAVVRGEPVTVRGRKRPIELLFNLEHPDHLAFVTEVNEDADVDEEGGETDADDVDSSADELMERFNKMAFVVSTRKLEQHPHWVKVSDVFRTSSDREFLRKAGVADFDDPRVEKYSKRLARLRDIRKYVYRMDVLESSMGYDEVTEIFVRVNSLGAKLRSSDLALAQITAKWRNSLSEFQAFQKSCAQLGFDLDLGIHLKNMVAFATGQSRFLTVGSLDVETLKSAWKESRRGMEFALNFMRSNVGITSPALLSSPFILIAIAYFGHRRDYVLKPEESSKLRYWILAANAKGRFSRGSSESILDQDLASLRQGGGTQEMIDRLRLQFGRLDITAEELEGRNQRSALFKTMFLAFHAGGATDWRSNLRISLDHKGSQDRLQFHHIFPKAVLRAAGRSLREADDISNLSFISGKTNRQISDKAPSTYIHKYSSGTGGAAFVAQCIPTEDTLLSVDAYLEFLQERRARIASKLNEFLES
ncbi:DUF262 domain-containing protein [Pseudoxanthomonas indica]|uniref:GmrSD restriction endonucleases N-terminal domain-containing protein n=1 Tax=Pseudoxanthomonas indica TaxID=428993 RepID=A0A1T5LCX9_9GAMM|nr:DUF262 domain-containing protein [Pseudoxanthomonas indica]GGD33697.1 hypothetical protein GCM10007235_01980 [Pseudoxanthomonas indica]SKC73841.1 hypothetical protein SAMN06296058_2324 [Pseudoxanthomonas indica]